MSVGESPEAARTSHGTDLAQAFFPECAGESLARHAGHEETPMILMALEDIRPGMTLGVGLRNKEGHTLLGPGEALTAEYIARLIGLGYCAVWIDDEDTRDIPCEDTLSEATRLATTSAIQDTFALTSREVQKLGSVSVEGIREMVESRRFQEIFRDHPIIERLTGHVDAVVREVLNRTVLTGLGSIRTHNSYTYHHCLDVAVTATFLGRMLGLDRETLKKLAVGCILHDIGNIFVDTEILEKRAALSEQEFARMKDHTVLGYLFIRDTLRLGVLPAHVAYQHHERQDGTGYPRGLIGTNRIIDGVEVHVPGRITPLGEIAAIADFHDACSADRPYRRRLPADRVWDLTRAAAGHHLNREMVDIFLTSLPRFPLGTQVTVLEGPWQNHVGVVARLNRVAMDRPVIRLLTSPAGERIEPVELDLSRQRVKIRGVLSAREAASELAAERAD
jgi:HD-GYP domain-containing protein (c-di-GMP phosphodiesterase class II)